MFLIFFFLLGVISIIAQALILREITNLFYGNEIFYGLGLGTWMVFGGLGSLLGIKLKKFIKHFNFLWIILVSLTFLLILLIFFWRWLVGSFVPLGELPNPLFVFLAIFPPLFIFCFVLGATFALGVSFWKPNLGYFWETTGFAVGGLLFSFVLATINFPYGLEWRYPNLEKVINSKYQQIILTKDNCQENYFINGQLAFTTQESYETKQILSLIIPFVKEPKEILVVGNPNFASELKRIFPTGRIVFLEIDKKLADLAEKTLISTVDLIIADPRRFLDENINQWDLIIFSLGNPQTLLGNRYFTKECFRQVKNRLNKEGIFALITFLPTDYQNEESTRFAGSLYQTIKTVFPALELLTPEDQLLFLVSHSELKIDKTKINSELKDWFWYHFNDQKRQKILEKISKTPVRVNTDFFPTAFFYQQLFWQTIFSFKLPVYLIKVEKISPIGFLITLFLLFLITSERVRFGMIAASSSFILMSLEILLIFIFQTKIGYLYSQIALIFATILFGIGLGVIIIENWKVKVENFKNIFLLYLPFLFLINQVTFWPIIALGIGIVGGMIFATLNKFYLKKFFNPGFIYAFDLFGGFLGASFTSSFLLPAMGLRGILGFMGGVILINLFFISKHPE